MFFALVLVIRVSGFSLFRVVSGGWWSVWFTLPLNLCGACRLGPMGAPRAVSCSGFVAYEHVFVLNLSGTASFSSFRWVAWFSRMDGVTPLPPSWKGVLCLLFVGGVVDPLNWVIFSYHNLFFCIFLYRCFGTGNRVKEGHLSRSFRWLGRFSYSNKRVVFYLSFLPNHCARCLMK